MILPNYTRDREFFPSVIPRIYEVIHTIGASRSIENKTRDETSMRWYYKNRSESQ